MASTPAKKRAPRRSKRSGNGRAAEREFERHPVDAHAVQAPAGPPTKLDRGPAEAPGRPLRGRGGARRRGRRARGPRPRPEGLRVRLRAARGSAPCQRRGLHRPPGRRGEDLRRHAARHRHALRGPAARHRRGHERLARRGHAGLRRRGGRARGRRDQAVRGHLPEPRRSPGRELPQDDGRHGPGHPGHPHQARRPPAQHAHARLDAEAEAAGEGQGDARDLRAARAPSRHPRDQVGARGSLLLDAPPAQVQRDQAAGQPAAHRARGLRLTRRPVSREGAGGRRHHARRSPGAPSTSTRSTRR